MLTAMVLLASFIFSVNSVAVPRAILDLDLRELALPEGTQIFGANDRILSGYSVSGLGDVSGDRIDDIIIGATQGNPGTRVDAGISYVLFGNRNFSLSSFDMANWATSATTGFRIIGAAANDMTGQCVSGAGDFNGDGLNDMMVASTVAGAGNVYMVFGRNATATPGLIQDVNLGTLPLSPTIVIRILGAYTGNIRLGTALSAAGDVNGDGLDDIIVAAPTADSPLIAPTANQAGVSYVVFGRSTSLADIDLLSWNTSKSTGYRIFGAVAGDQSGTTVSGAGDVNHDGVADILIGANQADPSSRVNAGMVYVLFGCKINTPNCIIRDINLATFTTSRTTGFRIIGGAAYDQCGFAVSAAGDVNGDGVDDVVVGAPYARTSTGLSYVIYGRAVTSSTTYIADIDLLSMQSSTTIGFRIIGGAYNDLSGGGVSSVGDVNGDGVDDVMVVAAMADSTSLRSDAGVWYVIFGSSTRSTDVNLAFMVTAPTTGFRVLGAASRIYPVPRATGTAAGDFNHDGYSDVLLSSYGSDYLARTYAGISYIVFGAPFVTQTTAPPTRDVDLTQLKPYTGYSVMGAMAGYGNGWSVGRAGDVNGDGLDDVIMGATVASYANRFGSGISFVLYGSRTTPSSSRNLQSMVTGPTTGFRIFGSDAYDRSGWAVNGAGDVNGDGIDDVIVAARFADAFGLDNSGTVYVIFGRKPTPGTWIQDVDLLTFPTGGNTIFRIQSSTQYDQLGQTVSSADDFNGDGVGDVIVGSRLYVCVIFGHNATRDSSSIKNVNVVTMVSGLTTGFRIVCGGECVGSRAGDVNGDGLADVIVGYASMSLLTSRSSNGVSYVIFGKNTTIGDITLSTFASSRNVGFRIIGAASNDYSGTAVSAAGDVNGDGVDDILVGAYLADVQGKNDAGVSYVIYGRNVRSNTPAFSDIDLLAWVSTSTFGFRIIGANRYDYSGFAIGNAGDVNKDDFDDLIVGAYMASNSVTNIDCGMAYVIWGSAARSTDVQLSSLVSGYDTAGIRMFGASVSNLGYAVSGAGDVNGDGFADVIIGAPLTGTDIVNAKAGASYVVYGTPFTSAPTSQPSGQPSGHPSTQPTSQPTQPTSQPSTQPSSRPTRQPSAQPSRQPFAAPSAQPTRQPQSRPSAQPSSQPSVRPSAQPSGQPTGRPSRQPSSQPSSQPSASPSVQPSQRPSCQPSVQPSVQPTSRPTSQPTRHPSSCPSGQPSVQPSGIPSAQPSSAPTEQPLAGPTAVPSEQPSSQPSSLPTALPSSKPSAQPTVQPSIQPSQQPTAVPTVHPTAWPSTQPTNQPSRQPTAQPTSRPSGQPSRQPSGQPSAQPSTQPSTRPTSVPSIALTRGAWERTLLNMTQLDQLSVWNDQLWACGGRNGVWCELLSRVDGDTIAQYQFSWSSIVSIIPSEAGSAVYMSGHTSSTTSTAAVCEAHQGALSCTAQSFSNTLLSHSAYSPYAARVVHVGSVGMYSVALVTDPATTTSVAVSYLYTATTLKSLKLLRIANPPRFVGCMIAGTAVTNSALNMVVAGWMNVASGDLSAQILSLVTGSVRNNADLVTAMVVESISADSLIVGGLDLSTDSVGTWAYLVRTNALYRTVQYGVRYRSRETGNRRRSLRGAFAPSAVGRGVVMVDDYVYVILDYVHAYANNSLVVIKADATKGDILKQVTIGARNGSISCTNLITVADQLCVSCSMKYINSATSVAVVVCTDKHMSFTHLPAEFTVTGNDTFYSESISFQATYLPTTKQNAAIASTGGAFVSGNSVPTFRPSMTPSLVPSVQPSSVPSAQPSSRPTAAPSVSARPTNQPSSATPTNTHKPSAAPTRLPTVVPTVSSTTCPSAQPTVTPTTRPTLPPSVPPTAMIPTGLSTVAPSRRPTVQPSRAPRTAPSAAPTRAPTIEPSLPIESESDTVQSNKRSMPSYVVGASVGAGLSLLLIGYILFRFHRYTTDKLDRQKRFKEYMLQQTAMLETAERTRMADMRIVLEKEKIRKQKKSDRARAAEAAREAAVPLDVGPDTILRSVSADSVGSSSESVFVSSEHSDDRDYASGSEYNEDFVRDSDFSSDIDLLASGNYEAASDFSDMNYSGDESGSHNENDNISLNGSGSVDSINSNGASDADDDYYESDSKYELERDSDEHWDE